MIYFFLKQTEILIHNATPNILNRNQLKSNDSGVLSKKYAIMSIIKTVVPLKHTIIRSFTFVEESSIPEFEEENHEDFVPLSFNAWTGLWISFFGRKLGRRPIPSWKSGWFPLLQRCQLVWKGLCYLSQFCINYENWKTRKCFHFQWNK